MISIVQLNPSSDPDDLDGKPLKEEEAITMGPKKKQSQEVEDEEWALDYIDVVHLDPIVEAIDDDFSGFISIHEANRFALARPDGWRCVSR